MPTELSYTPLGELRSRWVYEIGFCRESPKTVLGIVAQDYLVARYKEIFLAGFVPQEQQRIFSGRPLEKEFYGLNIRQANIPLGLRATQSIEGLLKKLRQKKLGDCGGVIVPDFRRTKKDIRRAVGEAINEYCGAYFEGDKLLGAIEEKRYLPLMLEIVSAVLGFKNPNSRDLRRLLI